ncbi:tudor domain-containing protein 5 isoform X2 [Rhinoderma darwinii]|uniref:tudor domain-containing protein 5 isoform X2 n=1 Tax=Rhinoderma darwinii TaxID=43563 RepID=UPI003F6615B4
MNKDRILRTLQKDLRSLLIASKLGLSIQELEHDYRMMIGSPIPLKSLDYRSTMELLLDMPDVVNLCTQADGTVLLSAVVNEETKSMAELVSRQKTTCKKKGVYKRRMTRTVSHMDLVRRGRVAPVLPASVKSELRDLLSISSLLVSQLENAFYKRFGRSFQYTRYGFYSLVEVLRSVADFVQVQQTRAGSLLMLKTPVTNSTLKGSSLQYSNPGNIYKGPSILSVNKEQNSTKRTLVTDSPLPSAVPQSEVTALDRLFLDAEAQYFANNRSPKRLSAEETHSEIVCSHVTTKTSDLENNITTSSLPSATAQAESTSNEPVNKLTPHVETDITWRQSLDIGTIKTDVAQPSTDCSLQWLEEKTRAGFVISNDLRQNIKHIVCKHAEGLPVSHLLPAFKQYTGKELQFQEMGFMSVLDLVGCLGDMLYLEDTKDGQDWRLFDIESKSKKNVDGERIDERELAADDSTSRWNFSTQKSERLKPPVIISPADVKSLWSFLDVSVLVPQQEIPPDAVRKQKLCSLSRMKRGFMIGVYVENVTSPSNFYIRCYSKDTSQKLEDLMIEMRLCYSNECVSSRYVVPDEYVIIGEIYALRVDGDVWWYRVIVHAVISSEEVQVFHPDFGTLATVKRRWLRFLKACYMTLPAQAVPSALVYLKPVEDQWSIEAIKSFQKQCARGPMIGVVLQYVSDQLCLFLCDTSTDEDIYLHQVLIDAGLARVSQEPGFYKNLQSRNPFVHYLIQSSEQSQEASQDTSGQSESNTAESLQVHLQEPVLQTRVKEEVEPELPYLEDFPIGEDMWDEKWTFSGSTASLNDALKLPSKNLGKDQEEEKPKLEKTNDGELISEPLEEFYISLIESRNILEKSAIPQSSPTKFEFEKTIQPAEDIHDQGNTHCMKTFATHFCNNADHSLPLTPEEEKLQYLEDNCLFNKSSSLNQTARGGNPLMGFQKFQIPRSSATIALGPAARLAATPGSLLNWVTEPGYV